MVRSWQRPTESTIEPDPLTTTQEVALELNTDYSVVVQHLKQTGKVEKLCKWAPHELTANQKDVILKCRILLFNITIMKHFPNKLLRAMKTGLYMTTRDDQLSGRTEKKLQSTSQSQTYTKKSHSHCLVVFWQSDPLQFSESQQNHYIWEVCSANRWDVRKMTMPTASIGQQKGLSSPQQSWPHLPQPTLQKLNALGYKVLLHPPYSPDLSPGDYHFFKHLNNILQGKCFYNKQEA